MNFIKGLFGLKDSQNKTESFLDYKGIGRLFMVHKKGKKCIFILSQISFTQGTKGPYERFICVSNLSSGSEFNTNDYYFTINPRMNLRIYARTDENHEIVVFEWELNTGVIVCYEFGTHLSESLLDASKFQYYICRLLYERVHHYPAINVKEEDLDKFCMFLLFLSLLLRGDRSKEEIYEEIDSPVYSASFQEHLLNQDTNLFFENFSEIHTEPHESQRITLFNFPGIKRGRSRTPKMSFDEGNENRSAGMEELIYNFEKKNRINRMSIERERRSSSHGRRLKTQKYCNQIKMLCKFPSQFCELNEYGELRIIINPQIAFSIVKKFNCDHYFELFDLEKSKIVYSKIIDEHLNYHLDDSRLAFQWIEINSNTKNTHVYGCPVPADMLNPFKLMFAKCLFESKHKLIAEIDKEPKRYNSARNLQNEIEIEDDPIEDGIELHQSQTQTNFGNFPKEPQTFLWRIDEDDDFTIPLPPMNSRPFLLKYGTPRSSERRSIFPKVAFSAEKRFTEDAGNFTARKKGKKNSSDESSDNDEKGIPLVLPKYICKATNGIPGVFATGSKKGEIRLFKGSGKNAKTLFPGVGDPIVHLDSTWDGEWLLATTKSYLMLIQTIVNGKNGYFQSISKKAKVPLKLALLPQDIKKYSIQDYSFKEAKVMKDPNSLELKIVGSTGKFQVIWDFQKVKNDKLDFYEIKWIIDNEDDQGLIFKHRNDNSGKKTQPIVLE